MINVAVLQPDSEQTRSFRTHASYVRAFRELALGGSWTSMEVALTQLHALAAEQVYKPPRTPCDCDLAEVESCLRRAWTTASLLEATHALAEESEIIRLANGWSTVQTYYVLYNAVQALLVAEGHERPQQHEQTKRQFVDLWAYRSGKMAPWSLAAAHPTARESDTEGFLAGPGRPLDTGLHPWTTWQGDQAWDIAAKALRTTRSALIEERLKKAREQKLSERRKAWQAECESRARRGRPARPEPRSANLTSAERGAVEKRIRPVTVADYLYRLRVKANYDDITVFADGPTTDTEAAAMASDLVDLASATLLVHEVRIAARIGNKQLVHVMDDALNRMTTYTDHLALRRDLHSRL
ncbi:hypothetical protein ABZ397_28795 [Streptomyces sp. NPDC005876]|jgi:hypothetical protein|uniref:hypothetical protein n=1 Tax=Streptomyces sp. NPDC005876 TaxID=3157076 RepID=UPI0033C23CC3